MKIGNVQFMVTEDDVPGMYKRCTAALFHLLYFFLSIMLNSEYCLGLYFKMFMKKLSKITYQQQKRINYLT